jgi:hypothetical protein
LNLSGNALTLSVRLRSPTGAWDRPLFSKHGGHDRLVYNLYASRSALGFELGTRDTPGMTSVTVSLAQIGADDWHDVVARNDGKSLQLFVDGVLMDEAASRSPLELVTASVSRTIVLLRAPLLDQGPKASFVTQRLKVRVGFQGFAILVAELDSCIQGGERLLEVSASRWICGFSSASAVNDRKLDRELRILFGWLAQGIRVFLSLALPSGTSTGEVSQ